MTSSRETELPPGARDSLPARVGAVLEGDRDGRGLRVGLACGLFNGGITWRLLEGALGGLEATGVDKADISVAWAPGAFELPLVARAYLAARSADAVVCLGAVIRGDTGHYDFVAGQSAAGIQQVALEFGAPVVFGVLTTDTVDQALARSVAGAANKGWEAAVTAVEMASLLRTAALSPSQALR
jgi:6,7-dimethyl-8-ribityllumazine synthase